MSTFKLIMAVLIAFRLIDKKNGLKLFHCFDSKGEIPEKIEDIVYELESAKNTCFYEK